MGLDIQIPSGVAHLLAGRLPNLKATVFHYALAYMLPLEGLKADGTTRTPHSSQAPQGIVRKNIPIIELHLTSNVLDAIEAIVDGAEPNAAMSAAIEDAATFALTTFVADTPRDTGRAWQTWAIRHVSGNADAETAPALGPSKYAAKNPGSRPRKPKGDE